MQNTCMKGNLKECENEKNTKTGVSNPNPLMGKIFSGDKRTSLKKAIWFYKVEGGDKSDSGDDIVTHIKTDKYLSANNKNNNKMKFPLIKPFGCQVNKVFRVLGDITFSEFNHLRITTWKGIDQRWMLF